MAFGRLVPWGQRELPVRRVSTSLPSSLLGFNQAFRDIEQLLEQSAQGGFEFANSGFNPQLDLHEHDNEYEVTLELPGLEEKDIEISLTRDTLTISGEKKEEKEDRSRGAHRLERRYGSFSRSVSLPRNGVDSDSVKASFKNGVLTVSLPKTPDNRDEAKKIQIIKDETENKGSA
ncbi:MAG TPA: Hsp20/alpha crystallin family protein [Oculatellaceae cyanobacterium]